MDKKSLKNLVFSGPNRSSSGNCYWYNTSFGEHAFTQRAWGHLENFYNDYSYNFFVGILGTIARVSNTGNRAVWKLDRNDYSITDPGSFIDVDFLYLEDFKNYQVRHSNKPFKIIEQIALRQEYDPFTLTNITKRDSFAADVIFSNELSTWIEHLVLNDLLFDNCNLFTKSFGIRDDDNPHEYEFALTPSAWDLIEDAKKGINSNKVFIAMSFNMNGREEIQGAIVEACRETGFEAKTVDTVEHNNKITDEIIAMINESAFVIADFSENNNGVYFEAGYTQGIGRPVIYCVHEDFLRELHFDTSQTNHIVYPDERLLKERLKNRIKATILKN